jgi:predicted DNA-binding transcriptional regulator YafY
VGKRAATETLFGIVAAFVKRRTWTQADLARELGISAEAVRKRLHELLEAGFVLEREEDHPHVYWSVRKDWFPGVLSFRADEVPDLLRLIQRMPTSELRDRVVRTIGSRLPNLARAMPEVPFEAGTGRRRDDEERWLSVVEDALAKKKPILMQYFTASRRSMSVRTASVAAIEHGHRPQFIALCHRSGAVRRFRVSNVVHATIDTASDYRAVEPAAIQRFRAESFGGFRVEGPVVPCAFFVRDADCEWVAKNLPDDRITEEAAPGGKRFAIETTAVELLARFVVGLGPAARAETPELARRVVALAQGAIVATGEAPAT